MSLSRQYVVAIRVTPQSAQLQSESRSELNIGSFAIETIGNEALGIKLKVDFFCFRNSDV